MLKRPLGSLAKNPKMPGVDLVLNLVAPYLEEGFAPINWCLFLKAVIYALAQPRTTMELLHSHFKRDRHFDVVLLMHMTAESPQCSIQFKHHHFLFIHPVCGLNLLTLLILTGCIFLKKEYLHGLRIECVSEEAAWGGGWNCDTIPIWEIFEIFVFLQKYRLYCYIESDA